jgi:hypothetical protein
MIKKLLLTLSAVSCLGAARAQTIAPCGADEVYRRQVKENPGILDKEAALRKEISEKLAAMDISKYAKTTADGDVEYHVPIVFHVVHDYGSELTNASDAEIVRCVKDINEMFNKKNADTADVIAPYKGFINNSTTPYIGNARITWHLATKDPFGNPTTGITHVRSYLTKTAGEMAKLDLWPASNYMNVWVVNTFKPSTDGTKPAAYALKPASADELPYYDGVISLAFNINIENTIAHELGHTLNLDHTFGGTNGDGTTPPFPWFVALCGDDEVDDTPPTKGHNITYCVPGALYDTACLNYRAKEMMKLRVDTIGIAKSTSTVNGIEFQSRTASILDSVYFFPTDTIGSKYVIALSRSGTVIATDTVITTVTNNTTKTAKLAQVAILNFAVPKASASTVYKLHFTVNPGALRDSITPALSTYPKGIPGSINLISPSKDTMYNFFYDWNFRYGYFKIYGVDSLVDYPDTVNSQNVMDYTYCSKMFTEGQVGRMRAALTSSVAHRDSLISADNLARTGALDPTPAIAPKADYQVIRASLASGTGFIEDAPAYFLCADDAKYHFQFKNWAWRAPVSSINWIMPAGASTPSSTSTTTVTSTFNQGWNRVSMVASNANGSDTFTTEPGVYAADPNPINPIGYYQEFNPGTDLDKWPMFNYYNNRYKWEMVNFTGYWDKTSMRYRTFDDRRFPENVNGDPSGDYDDFYSVAFDLSALGTNGNLNFMYAGAYNTNDSRQMKDSLEIFYSTTCGATWIKLTSMSGPKLQTAGTTVPGKEFVPEYTDWRPMSIDLRRGTSPVRDNKVFFRFRYRPYGRSYPSFSVATGNNFFIDRINISNNPLGVNEMILGDRQIAVSPNPTHSNAYVLFSKPNAKVNIEVTDVTGKVVYRISDRVNEQDGRIEIPASAISVKGMYLVHVTGDDNLRQTEKLIVY